MFQPSNVLLQFDGLMLPGRNLETEAAILAEVIAAVLVEDNKGLSKFRESVILAGMIVIAEYLIIL